jgi:hypothetical protein
MNSVNLIPANRRAAAAREKRIRTWGIIGAGYALILLGVCGALAADTGEIRTASQAALKAQQRLDKVELEMTKASAALAATRVQLEAARAVGKHPDWSRLLAAIADLKGDRVALTQLELSSVGVAPESTDGTPAAKTQAKQRSYALRIAGLAEEAKDASAFVAALEASQVFDEVLLQEAKSARFNDRDIVTFRIGAVLREGREDKR